MNYNLLGKSDLRISEVGFGCMSLGNDHTANTKLLREAFDRGVNFFDTADIYGKGENEQTVGEAFKGMRGRVIIATKVGNIWKADGSGLDWSPTKSHILQSVEDSLRRLQTTYIDLYQLHGGTIQDPIDEVVETFELLKRQGKIRHYGISSIRPDVIRAYVKSSSIVSVMMQYSVLDRRPEETCLELLGQHTIGVLVRGSLAKGLLVDKSAALYLSYDTTEIERVQHTVQRLSNEKRTATETALRFTLNSSTIKSVIVGIRTTEQLHRCINVSNTPPLTDDEMDELRTSIRPSRYEEHR